MDNTLENQTKYISGGYHDTPTFCQLHYLLHVWQWMLPASVWGNIWAVQSLWPCLTCTWKTWNKGQWLWHPQRWNPISSNGTLTTHSRVSSVNKGATSQIISTRLDATSSIKVTMKQRLRIVSLSLMLLSLTSRMVPWKSQSITTRHIQTCSST